MVCIWYYFSTCAARYSTQLRSVGAYRIYTAHVHNSTNSHIGNFQEGVKSLRQINKQKKSAPLTNIKRITALQL